MFAAVKDPQATLDYRFDWAAWLTTDTISTVTWTVPAGITQTAATNTTTTATIWLSGGAVGTRYAIACKITTTAGRIDERSLIVSVQQK